MNEHRSGCLICGADLAYREGETRACSLCGETGRSDVACTAGHYVCDVCHALSAMLLIARTCERSTEADPLVIADGLMRHSAIKMHGPEHHYLVPAALITAWCIGKGIEGREEMLAIARKRAADVKGGFCGYHGTCGAAMGAGIACSVLTGATPLARDGWRLSNLMTAACLTAIGEAGGPRCCKRDSYLALITGRDFLNSHLMADIPAGPPPVCSHYVQNRECLATDCRFFPSDYP